MAESTTAKGRLTVTVFGSCRVHTPCSLLQKSGVVAMNQRNIFGFVHCTSEIIQQFGLIVGARTAPARLRPYLNIPARWEAPGPQDLSRFHDEFEETDIFVVEVSSIRELLFKAFFLQINRTRELLVPDDSVQKSWWMPLVRYGENRVKDYNLSQATETQKEIVRQLQAKDQAFDDILSDLKKIKAFLRKPVLFVSHFNTDYGGGSVPQRKLIIDAMRAMAPEKGCHFFDPTPDVFDTGLGASIQDLGHYRPDFEPRIAERLREKMLQAIATREHVYDQA